jgi:hypothetical protein
MDLDQMRSDLARRTRRGIGMPLTGALWWLGLAALGSSFPARTANLVAFFATGAVFPIGWLLTRACGGDLMARSPLTALGMQLNFVQFAYWPVLIAVHYAQPQLVPFTFAVLFGSHFMPYGWYYRSAGYLLLGIGAPLAATLMQIFAPQASHGGLPLALAAVHLLAVARLAFENRTDLAPISAAPTSNRLSIDGGR